MKNLAKNIKSSITLLAIVVLVTGCAKKERPQEEVRQPEALTTLPGELKVQPLDEEQKILSFDMTGYEEDGKKKWEIRGESADIISEKVLLGNIEARSYNDDRTVSLKAESGEYDKKENSVILKKNVVVTTSDGVTLEAEWFAWNSKTSNIMTDSFVEVNKDNLYASGYGGFANTDSKEIRLNKDIVVRQADMSISCSGPLIIDYNNDKATFSGHVIATEPKGELIADKLEMFLNRESKKIQQVVAQGDVELRRGQNIAKGQKITYDVATGEAVLTGNPEVIIYSKKEIDDALIGN